MRFVVTGTGRSGTGYAAQLFTAAGLPCGHEDAFRARPAWAEKAAVRNGRWRHIKAPVGRIREGVRRARLDLAGDASWMATPRLDRFRGVKFLQTRSPIEVIRSFTGTRFFSEPTLNTAQHGYACAHFDAVGDDVIDTMRWWVYWNRMAKRNADMIYQLEQFDADRFAAMLDMLGEQDVSRRAAEAILSVPPGVNSGAGRGHVVMQLEWSDLPAGRDLDELCEAAVEFGYSAP